MATKASLSPGTAKGEVNRYCAWPTQAPSYLTGAIEIEKIRDEYTGDLEELPRPHRRKRGPAAGAGPQSRARLNAAPVWRVPSGVTASVDLALLRSDAHSPSYFALRRGAAGDDLVDFCIPCNPYFPTTGMFDDLRANLVDVLKYYPSDAETITKELCATLDLNPSTIAMGNGSTELITWLDHLMVRESLAVPVPTFGRWTDQPLETGKRCDMFPLLESQGFRLDVENYVRFVRERGSRVAVICNPNNPDGAICRATRWCGCSTG